MRYLYDHNQLIMLPFILNFKRGFIIYIKKFKIKLYIYKRMFWAKLHSHLVAFFLSYLSE